ncbi:MAG: replication factor C large subunit [Desulfurococcaceae archaeon]
MSTTRLPWIIKYRPKHLDEVVNQDKAKQALLEWLKSWERGAPSKKAVLLHGPPGCGKTSLVEAIAKTLGYELFEMNASDSRRKEDIERLAKAASQTSGLRARRKIVLLDEVDGLDPRTDAGGVEAILDVIRNARNPIIMTANNPYREHLKPLRDISEVIAMDRLKETHVVTVLNRICQAEKLQCDQQALEEIAKRSEGDLRSAINDLEAVSSLDKKVTVESVKAISTYRNRVYAPWEALRKLFSARYVFQAREAITSTDLTPDEVKTWINEHIPSWYDNPEEIWRAYEALSRADQYFGRIIKTQNWDLLSYALDMMGPGVAFARKSYKGKFVAFKMPERIKLLAETKKSREYREALAEHLARRLLTSKATVKTDVIPYLRIIFTNNPKYAANIARAYNLPEDLVTWLAGPRAKEIISYLKKPIRKKS